MGPLHRGGEGLDRRRGPGDGERHAARVGGDRRPREREHDHRQYGRERDRQADDAGRRGVGLPLLTGLAPGFIVQRAIVDDFDEQAYFASIRNLFPH
ncbi:MAG: hypothetical protein IRY85_16945 [Micromonosporaceae bacterium]|nr:hypothetical protein [Micromonosporaceae bacterium]